MELEVIILVPSNLQIRKDKHKFQVLEGNKVLN